MARGSRTAGKTGTAEQHRRARPCLVRFHRPVSEGEIVVVAFAQNTPGGGSVHALPMAKAVLETWNRTRLGQAAVSASTLSSTPR